MLCRFKSILKQHDRFHEVLFPARAHSSSDVRLQADQFHDKVTVKHHCNAALLGDHESVQCQLRRRGSLLCVLIYDLLIIAHCFFELPRAVVSLGFTASNLSL